MLHHIDWPSMFILEKKNLNKSFKYRFELITYKNSSQNIYLFKSYSTFIGLSLLSSKCHFLKSDLQYTIFNNLGLKKVVSEYEIILNCWFLSKKLIFHTFNQVFKTILLNDHLQGFLSFEIMASVWPLLLGFKTWYGAFQKS